MGAEDDKAAIWREVRSLGDRVLTLETQQKERTSARAERDALNERRFGDIEEQDASHGRRLAKLELTTLLIRRDLRLVGLFTVAASLLAPSVRDLVFKMFHWG